MCGDVGLGEGQGKGGVVGPPLAGWPAWNASMFIPYFYVLLLKNVSYLALCGSDILCHCRMTSYVTSAIMQGPASTTKFYFCGQRRKCRGQAVVL